MSVTRQICRKTGLTLGVVLAIALAASKRAHRSAKLTWLLKRLLGSLLIKVLPVPIPQVVSGEGSTAQIADVLKGMGKKKPLIVTDANIVKFGLMKPCMDAMNTAGFQPEVYDKVVPNPPAELVEEGYEVYKKGCDCIVAFGGGSPMDTAKIIGAKVANPQPIPSYQGFFKVSMMGLKPLPPLVAVPTTAGTGSETTIAAVISLPQENKKIAIADLGLVPSVAVLDPKLLEKLPKSVTAATGMDALTHAVESYIGGWSTAFTRQKSLDATGKIMRHLHATFRDGADFKSREDMLNAAFDAGVAFTRANVGYVHAIAHQLGGMFHTPHGDANAMLLPYLLECYLEDEGEDNAELRCTTKYCELAKASGMLGAIAAVPADDAEKRTLARQFVQKIREMNAEMSIPTSIKDMRAEHVSEVATRALNEAHGSQHGLTNPFGYLLDLGYPVPKYLSQERCEQIVSEILPADQRTVWNTVYRKTA